MGMNTNYDKGGADSIQPLQPPTTQKAGKQAPIGQVEKKITNVADKLNSLESPPSKLDTKIKTIAEQVKSVMALKKQYSQLASPEDKHAFLMKALAGTKDENYAVLSILLDEEKDSKQYQGAGHRLKELCDESGQNFVQLSSALLEVKKIHDIEEKMTSQMQTSKKNFFPDLHKNFSQLPNSTPDIKADSIQPPTTQKTGNQAPTGQVEKKITNVADKLKSLESAPSKIETQIKTMDEQVNNVMALKKQYSQLASPEDKHAFLMKALAGSKDENYAVLSILLDEEKDSKQYQGAGHRLKELCDESGQNFVQLSSALLEVKKFHDMEEKMSSEMQTTKKNHFPNIDKKFFE